MITPSYSRAYELSEHFEPSGLIPFELHAARLRDRLLSSIEQSRR